MSELTVEQLARDIYVTVAEGAGNSSSFSSGTGGGTPEKKELTAEQFGAVYCKSQKLKKAQLEAQVKDLKAKENDEAKTIVVTVSKQHVIETSVAETIHVASCEIAALRSEEVCTRVEQCVGAEAWIKRAKQGTLKETESTLQELNAVIEESKKLKKNKAEKNFKNDKDLSEDLDTVLASATQAREKLNFLKELQEIEEELNSISKPKTSIAFFPSSGVLSEPPRLQKEDRKRLTESLSQLEATAEILVNSHYSQNTVVIPPLKEQQEEQQEEQQADAVDTRKKAVLSEMKDKIKSLRTEVELSSQGPDLSNEEETPMVERKQPPTDSRRKKHPALANNDFARFSAMTPEEQKEARDAAMAKRIYVKGVESMEEKGKEEDKRTKRKVWRKVLTSQLPPTQQPTQPPQQQPTLGNSIIHPTPQVTAVPQPVPTPIPSVNEQPSPPTTPPSSALFTSDPMATGASLAAHHPSEEDLNEPTAPLIPQGQGPGDNGADDVVRSDSDEQDRKKRACDYLWESVKCLKYPWLAVVVGGVFTSANIPLSMDTHAANSIKDFLNHTDGHYAKDIMSDQGMGHHMTVPYVALIVVGGLTLIATLAYAFYLGYKDKKEAKDVVDPLSSPAPMGQQQCLDRTPFVLDPNGSPMQYPTVYHSPIH